MTEMPQRTSMINIRRTTSRIRVGTVLLVGLAMGLPVPSVAQDFTPPDEEPRSTTGVHLGLYGFSSRFGFDFTDDQPILGVALDFGNLGTDRVRFRPSLEVGFGEGSYTYTSNAEIVYRFTGDTEAAVPYVGFGVGVFVRRSCGSADGCPAVWAQFALGFEVHIRNNLDWFIEYHGEDALSRQRFFLGLATRRGF